VAFSIRTAIDRIDTRRELAERKRRINETYLNKRYSEDNDEISNTYVKLYDSKFRVFDEKNK
jgi:hypothetical protein